MTICRALFSLLAGAAGLAGFERGAGATAQVPELKRISYRSERTGAERDYFVYLPSGRARQKDWSVILFLHGDGERGDGKVELDYVLSHEPLYEACLPEEELPKRPGVPREWLELDCRRTHCNG